VVCTFWKIKFLSPAGNQTPDRPTRDIVTELTELHNNEYRIAILHDFECIYSPFRAQDSVMLHISGLMVCLAFRSLTCSFLNSHNLCAIDEADI
jgi:hypothetical protein